MRQSQANNTAKQPTNTQVYEHQNKNRARQAAYMESSQQVYDIVIRYHSDDKNSRHAAAGICYKVN